MTAFERKTTLYQSVIAFRAPEVKKAILAFESERFFYQDETFEIKDRFDVWDHFLKSFFLWSREPLSHFFSYPIAGSTEAIDWCLRDLKLRRKRLVILDEEYGYYPYVAELLGIPIKRIRDSSELSKNDDVFVTSIPFCRSGKVTDLQLSLLKRCESLGVEVWIDAAYFGACESNQLIIPTTTSNVFFSFSKQFAMALNRIGLWFRRDLLPEKEVIMQHGYFAVGSYALVTKLLESFDKDWLFRSYNFLQREVAISPTKIVYICEKKGCLTMEMSRLVDHSRSISNKSS